MPLGWNVEIKLIYVILMVFAGYASTEMVISRGNYCYAICFIRWC